MSGFKDNLSPDNLDFNTRTIHADDTKSHADDQTKDEFSHVGDSISVIKDLTSVSDDIKKDVEVVDSNFASGDPIVTSETEAENPNVPVGVSDYIKKEPDVKTLDSCDITRDENAYSGKKADLERKLDDSSIPSIPSFNVLGEDTDITSETYFKFEEFDDIVSVKEESCVKKDFKVDCVDDSNDAVASCGESAECTEIRSTDPKTNPVTTKKGKVSFNIDSSMVTKMKEASTSEGTTPKKVKLTPNMLNKIKNLLLQKSHSSGIDEFYIGDLINAVEGELMDLPKKRKRLRSGNREEKIKHLTKNKIRSVNVQRRNTCLNMQVLSSSMNTEFKNIDEILLNLRQAGGDFNSEFNQPHTPIGEPNAASLRMDELFSKIKLNLPLLQDSFKEVKHCLRLYVRADMSQTDNLHNIIQTHFADKLKVKNIPRVRYSEVLKTLMVSNRQHCHLDFDASAIDETDDTSDDHDKV